MRVAHNSHTTRTRTNNKLNPLMTPGPGFESAPHWWEVSIITAAPPLLPSFPLFSGLLFLETF